MEVSEEQLLALEELEVPANLTAFLSDEELSCGQLTTSGIALLWAPKPFC